MTSANALFLQRITVGPLLENCYLIGGENGSKALLVDPGDEADRIVAALEASGRELEAILLTHAHFDHVGALADLDERFAVPVLMHPDDLPLLENASLVASSWGIDLRQPEVVPQELDHGQRLELADLSLICLHTPGHAPGHIAFHLPAAGALLAGDALFKGSIGRTDLPLGNHQQLLRSLREQLLVLPPHTVVWPGHGDETTIGAEARSNPFLT